MEKLTRLEYTGGGQILGSPIEMAGHPNNSAALPRSLWYTSRSPFSATVGHRCTILLLRLRLRLVLRKAESSDDHEQQVLLLVVTWYVVAGRVGA